MARTYSGREWKAILGIVDSNAGSSAGAIGAATHDANTESGTKAAFRVTSPLNDVAWDAGYQRAEIERAGYRGIRNNEIINHYGSGTWTWDFEYPADNEMALQNLLTLIYPSAGDVTTAFTLPANPLVEDYDHGNEDATNKCGVVILENPLAAKDRVLNSAILQNLTLAMDASTNGGLLTASGQMMTGYKPLIETNSVAVDTAASDYNKGLFDCTTHTIAGAAATFKSFSITLENPANRIGYQGSAGETDGYSRGSAFKVTGTMSVKADSTVQGYLESKWNTNTSIAIAIGDGTNIDFSIPAANISAFNLDQADEGTFVEIAWTATAGTAAGNLAVIKLT